VLKPRSVVEIGTGEGLSALTMLKFLPGGATLTTFDIVPWAQYPRSCLRSSDFADRRFAQILANLSEPETFAAHTGVFESADLVFIDGPKDRRFEQDVVNRFGTVTWRKPPLFVFDDIRIWNMLAFWNGLRWPKLDLTSFGHWSGTGLADCPAQPSTT
jgi:hypothetical protein